MASQNTPSPYAVSALLDHQAKLRDLARLLASRGVTIFEDAPLVDIIEAVRTAPAFPEATKIYKGQQFDSYPDTSLPPLSFEPSAQGYYTFWKSNLQRLPPLIGQDKIVSFEGFCDASTRLGEANLGALTSATRIDAIFRNCSALRRVSLSTSEALVNMSQAFINCDALTDIEGVLDVSSVTNSNSAFYGCIALKEVRIKGLKSSLDMNNCRSLSDASLRYLIDNAQEESNAVITLSSRLSSRPELKETLTYVENEAAEKGFVISFR